LASLGRDRAANSSTPSVRPSAPSTGRSSRPRSAHPARTLSPNAGSAHWDENRLPHIDLEPPPVRASRRRLHRSLQPAPATPLLAQELGTHTSPATADDDVRVRALPARRDDTVRDHRAVRPPHQLGHLGATRTMAAAVGDSIQAPRRDAGEQRVGTL